MSSDALFGLTETQLPCSHQHVPNHILSSTAQKGLSTRLAVTSVKTNRGTCPISWRTPFSLSKRKVHWYWNVHSKMLLYFWAEDNVLQKELLTLIKAYSKRKYTDAFCQGKKKSAPPSQSLWGKGGAQTHMLHPTLIFSISLHACSGNLFSILQRSIVEKKKFWAITSSLKFECLTPVPCLWHLEERKADVMVLRSLRTEGPSEHTGVKGRGKTSSIPHRAGHSYFCSSKVLHFQVSQKSAH